MNILIVGASGFVGKYLVQHIKDTYDWEIIATKRSSDNFQFEDTEIVNLDITSVEDVNSVIVKYKPNYLINLAAQSSVRNSWNNPQRTIEINVIGTLNLLEAIRIHSSHTKILLVGSSEEYGNSIKRNIKISENFKLNPNNPYAISKYTQNNFVRIYFNVYNLNIMSTRSFNHVGPGQSEIFVVSDFCKQVAQIENNFTKPIINVGNIDLKRDFTDVRDIVVAYCKLIEFGVSGETYNVGSGRSISIREILNKILKLSNTEISVIKDIEKYRPNDVISIKADISKILRTTNWYPIIDIDKTILDTLNYWRKLISK
jgi:GDP-4-dehydro-6-deoxy-D-mannose reductase